MVDNLNDLKRAADTVRKFVHQFKDLLLVGEALDQITSLEQYALESNARIEDLKKKTSTALHDAEVAEGNLAAIQQHIVDEQRELENISYEREKKQKKTDEMLIQLDQQYNSRVEDVSKKIEAKEKELADVNRQLVSANNELTTVNAEIQTKQNALAAIIGKK